MSHRAHLFSLRIGHTLRESCIAKPYNGLRFRKDLLAGLTVGIITIPLAMALAITSGVAPHYGLYTAAIADMTRVVEITLTLTNAIPTAKNLGESQYKTH